MIFILIVLIPLMSIGYAFLLKSSVTSYYYHSESPESRMQNRINELTKLVEGGFADSQFKFDGDFQRPGMDIKFPGMPGMQEDPQNSLDELEMLQYARSKGYEPDSWKIEALYKAFEYKSQARTLEGSGDSEDERLYLQYTKAADDIYAAVDRDDLIGYYDICMRILGLQNAEGDYEKATVEAEKAVLQLRIDKKIPVISRFSDYRTTQEDWQNETLNALFNDIYNLKMNRNNQGMQLSDEERRQLEGEIEVNTYRIKNDKPPVEANSLYGFLSVSSSLVSFISLFIIIIAATMMASEYSQGTIKLMLISPYKRWKLFYAKLTTVFLVSLLLLVILFASSVLAGGLAFGFDFAGSLIKYNNGRVEDMPYIFACLLKYLLACPELLVMTSLSVMLAVVMRRSSLAIGVGVGFMFGGSIISTILAFMPYDFKRFLLFLNTNLSAYFPELNSIRFFDMVTSGVRIEGMTFTFSLIVLAVYFICFTYIALDSFNRRDVKQA